MPVWSRAEVIAFLDRVEPALDHIDHFGLLDVAIDASDQGIQDAYHGMAAALHPDRHRRDLSPEQLERLTRVFARISEAYRVLRDPWLREVYLRDVARKVVGRRASGTTLPAVAGGPGAGRDAPSRSPPTHDAEEAAQLARLGPKAQRLYRRAQASLRTGDRTSALLTLRMALAAHPTSTFLKESLAAIECKK